MTASDPAPQRRIPFEQVFNFRDLGGYRAHDGRTLRWRTLFRSDGLQAMTDADRSRFSGLGIRTVVDLRNPTSVERGPAAVPQPVTVHPLPFIDDEGLRAFSEQFDGIPSSEWYADVLQRGQASGVIRQAFDVFCDPATYPASFNCSLGKDRAGLMAALLLGAVGVDVQQIVDDYALSEGNLGPLRERYEANREEYVRKSREKGEEPQAPMKPEAYQSPQIWMRGALDAIQAEHGSLRAFIEAQEVAGADLLRLADLLLE